MLTSPRLYFAMAQDGVFFHAIGQLHPRTGAPGRRDRPAGDARHPGHAVRPLRADPELRDAGRRGLHGPHRALRLRTAAARPRSRRTGAGILHAGPSRDDTVLHRLLLARGHLRHRVVPAQQLDRSRPARARNSGVLLLAQRVDAARGIVGRVDRCWPVAIASGPRSRNRPRHRRRPAAVEGIAKFAIARSPIQLAGDARPRQYLGVVGRKAAWLGTETGDAELWVHPLKLATHFRLDFKIPDYVDPIRGADVARRVDVRPELTTITYSHATFTVREHILVPLDEPGILVLLDVDTVRPLEIVASFRSVFQYAWPGALGGQYTSWNAAEKAFLMSESRRQHNAFIGSPWTATASDHPAHALPDAPSTFVIPVDRSRIARRAHSDCHRRRDCSARRGARDLSAAAEPGAGALRCTARARRAPAHRAALDRYARRHTGPGLRVGEGEPRRADGLQPGPRVRPRRRLGSLGREHAPRLRLVLRRRRRDQLVRDVEHRHARRGGEPGFGFSRSTSAPTARSRTRSRRRRDAFPGSPTFPTPTITPIRRRTGSSRCGGPGRRAATTPFSRRCGRRWRRRGPGASRPKPTATA